MGNLLHDQAPAGLALPAALIAAVEDAYRVPPRAYHTIAHVEEVVRLFAEVAREVGWQQPREVYLAILFHDAIYTAGARDNETRSAQLARDAIAKWLPDAGIDADRVAHLIVLTKNHGHLTSEVVDPEAALFLDCDMAILGADAETFDAYEHAIATEYASVPRDAFVFGRRAFLEHLQSLPHIFLSDWGHRRFDVAARDNVRSALGSL